MNKSKELLCVRYIVFIFLIYQLFCESGNNSLFSLIFILLIIINNNLRVFFIENEKIKIISIALEFMLIPIAQLSFGGWILFYLIGAIIDVFTLKNKYIKRVFIIVSVLIGITEKFNESFESGIVNLFILGVFIILLNYIERLYSTKLEAQKLYDKLRVSEEKLIEANNELEGYVQSIEEITLLKERNRISREIHDSVGHALSTAMIQLSAMEAIGKKEKSSLGEMAGNLREFINESFQDVKKAVKELKPDEYDNYQGVLRIQEVCKNFKKMSGVDVKVIVSKGEWNLSTKQVGNLYRITQEVLSNALRHGKATVVNIIMNFTEDDFVISFKDNGKGTDTIQESGVGLKSIRERVNEMNGLVDIKSSIDNGFFIKITIPKEKEI